MMRKGSLLLVCLFSTWLGYSQSDQSLSKQTTFFGVKGGINISKLPHDEADLDFGTQPTVGPYLHFLNNKKASVSFFVLYSLRKSKSLKPEIEIEGHYIDVGCLAHYRLTNYFRLQSGAIVSHPVKSYRIEMDGSGSNGTTRVEINDYKNELHAAVGMDVTISDNSSLEFNYLIPVQKNSFKGFLITINIVLHPRSYNLEYDL